MKEIKQYEEAIANKVTNLEAEGINRTMFKAYRHSRRAGSDDLNFDDIVWDTDIEYIVNTCRAEGIEQMTVSSTFSSLTEAIWGMIAKGCTVEGMKLVPTTNTYYDEQTDTYVREKVPAFIIKIN